MDNENANETHAEKAGLSFFAFALLFLRIATVYFAILFGGWALLAFLIGFTLYSLTGLSDGTCLLIGAAVSFVVFKVAIFFGAQRLIPRNWTHGTTNLPTATIQKVDRLPEFSQSKLLRNESDKSD